MLVPVVEAVMVALIKSNTNNTQINITLICNDSRMISNNQPDNHKRANKKLQNIIT